MTKPLKELTDAIMKMAEEKGWGIAQKDINFAEKIALIHSEISETLEAYRKDNLNERHGVSEEIADSLIRILHLCGVLKIDLEKEILKKMEINDQRDWRWDRLYRDKYGDKKENMAGALSENV